jgi:ABC-2 type transport system ATP-binding protein
MAVIEAKGLSKRYGKTTAVHDLSFTVEPGRVTGFLGPNGSGKSTTCRLMVGLDRGQGSTTFDGRRFDQLPSPLNSVGVLLEAKAFHPSRSARNHLRMLCVGAGLDVKRADQCLEMVGLSEVGSKKPKGFSLGMGQRLGLAAALLGDPDTLILDEPSNGLDPQGIHWLREFLKHFASQGRSVFVSSHLLSEMELMADHLVVIGAGRMIADCSAAEFVARGAKSYVVVRSPDSPKLVDAMHAAGRHVVVESDGALTITESTLAEVGDIAFRAAVPLHELSERRSSLEDVFIELTSATHEYRTEMPAEPTKGTT